MKKNKDLKEFKLLLLFKLTPGVIIRSPLTRNNAFSLLTFQQLYYTIIFITF